jgi:hypothetical protein
MGTSRTASLVVACSLFLLPVVASAQSGIAGVVRDASGAVLPGVTVEAASPALIEKVRVAVTDGQGVYRIVDLRPGAYTVTFTLPGFNALRRDGIQLRAEFTATVDAQLSVGALEETITVSGAAPLVDIRSSREQTQFQSETLQSIPGTGRLTTLSSVIPGATLTRPDLRNVGGINDRAQTLYSIHGAPEAQPVMDGMNHQMNQLNQGVFIYNSLTVQEVVVETSGVGADRDHGGMQMNMIGKDGGNAFSGMAIFAYTGPDLESSNINDTLLARGLDRERVGAIKRFRDSGMAVGGPIQRGRLWFFAAARETVTQQFVEGLYFNKLRQPQSLLYEADVSRPAFSNNYSKDVTLRFTWQATQKHKIVAANSFQPNCNCRFNIETNAAGAARRTPEAAGPHQYNPNYIPTFSWTYPATNRLLFEAGGSAQVHNQHDKREPGWDHTSYRITDQALNLIYGNVATRTLPRRQYQERVAVSYVTGTHNFKTGINLRQTGIGNIERLGHDLFMHGPAVEYQFRNAVPNQLTLLDAPWNFEEHIRDIAIYAQDQWTIDRLTLNLGVRFNDASASTPEQVLGAGFFVPERRFAPTKNVPHWQNLSPRVGAAYDLFGTGRTAVKVTLGLYPDQLRSAAANPAVNLTRNTRRTWNDANRNFAPDCDLLNPVANGECGPWSDLNFGKPRPGTRFADDALEGFNKQFHNWQASASVQHELMAGVGLNVGYFRTWYGGFLATDNLAVTPADFDEYCITAPADIRLPGGGGNQFCGLYDVKPAKFGLIDNLIAQASHFGNRTQVFNGADVTLNVRFAEGAQFSGGLSMGRTVTDNCLVVDSPQDARDGFCEVTQPWSAGTQVKFLVVYPLPWGVQTSAIYQTGPGIPITASQVVTNAAIAPSLGRNLAACGNRVPCTANNEIALIPDQTMFEPRYQQLDLRVSRMFRLAGTARLRGNLDLHNIFNASDVLNMNTRYGDVWQNPITILGGRLLKLSAQFDF